MAHCPVVAAVVANEKVIHFIARMQTAPVTL
jgi:hypothetical protein